MCLNRLVAALCVTLIAAWACEAQAGAVAREIGPDGINGAASEVSRADIMPPTPDVSAMDSSDAKREFLRESEDLNEHGAALGGTPAGPLPASAGEHDALADYMNNGLKEPPPAGGVITNTGDRGAVSESREREGFRVSDSEMARTRGGSLSGESAGGDGLSSIPLDSGDQGLHLWDSASGLPPFENPEEADEHGESGSHDRDSVGIPEPATMTILALAGGATLLRRGRTKREG